MVICSAEGDNSCNQPDVDFHECGSNHLRNRHSDFQGKEREKLVYWLSNCVSRASPWRVQVWKGLDYTFQMVILPSFTMLPNVM